MPETITVHRKPGLRRSISPVEGVRTCHLAVPEQSTDAGRVSAIVHSSSGPNVSEKSTTSELHER